MREEFQEQIKFCVEHPVFIYDYNDVLLKVLNSKFSFLLAKESEETLEFLFYLIEKKQHKDIEKLIAVNPSVLDFCIKGASTEDCFLEHLVNLIHMADRLNETTRAKILDPSLVLLVTFVLVHGKNREQYESGKYFFDFLKKSNIDIFADTPENRKLLNAVWKLNDETQKMQ